MTIRVFLDAALTSPISTDGDFSNPDSEAFDGTNGEEKDRQLWIANEQATLTVAVGEGDNQLTLSRSTFPDGSTVVIGGELIRILTGGDTLTPTVQRGFAGSPVSAHANGETVYSGFDYANLTIGPYDQSGADERNWYRLASTQAGLDTATDGQALALGAKPHNQTLTFWRRISVPAATPVQTKVDLGLELTGIESPAQPGGV